MSVNYFEVLLARMERMQSVMKALMPSHGYARVVTVSPLVVETEQQPTELPANTVAPRLEVNDRVWFIRYLGRVMVVGKAGGFDVPAPASQAEVDAGVDNENYVTAKTLAERSPDVWHTTFSITVTSAAHKSASITFPAGMFGVPPIVHVAKTNGALAKYVPYINAVTTSGCTVGLQSGDNTSASGTQTLNFTAFKIG